MNRTEHLLVCVVEECAEISKAATKALRFGLKNGNSEKSTTNAEDIIREFHDLVAVLTMLDESGDIPSVNGIETDKNIKDKIYKVEKYLNLAKGWGTFVE